MREASARDAQDGSPLVSPSTARSRTMRDLRRARVRYGDLHPATWAAYGRAITAWGSARLGMLAPPVNSNIELALIAVVAASRASQQPGFSNRHRRARRIAVAPTY